MDDFTQAFGDCDGCACEPTSLVVSIGDAEATFVWDSCSEQYVDPNGNVFPVHLFCPDTEQQAAQPLSVEQLCRDLLEIAVKHGLVRPAQGRTHRDVVYPQSLTSSDLAGMANRLAESVVEFRRIQ